MKLKRLKGGKYQVRWRDEQKQQRAKNFDTKLEAVDLIRRIERGDLIPKVDPKAAMPFGEFALIWLDRYARLETGPTSQLKFRQVLRDHLGPTLNRLRLMDLQRSHLLDVRTALLNKGLGNKTVRDSEAIAKCILSVAVDWGYITASPWTGMKAVKQSKPTNDFWTAAERDRFVTWCRTRDPAFAELVIVATWTGLRRGELHALQVRQLDFDRRMIRVDATWSEHLQARLNQTKNGEVGWVPMADAVYHELINRKLAQGTETPVFDPTLFRDAYWRLRRRAKECGVKEIRFHDLRHTAASIWVMAGKPLYTVQKLMRHKSIVMTERYAHLSPEYLKGAAEIGECTKSALEPKNAANQAKL